MSGTRYEIALTITAKDAGPEDVVQITQTIGELAAKSVVTMNPATAKALRQLASVNRRPWDTKMADLREAIQAHGGDKEAIRQTLGISRSTLDQWLERLKALPRASDGKS